MPTFRISTRIIVLIFFAVVAVIGASVYIMKQNSLFVPYPSPVPSPVPVSVDCNGPGGRCAPGYTCIQKCGPPVARAEDLPPGYYCELDSIAGKPRMCPICLASNTNISTPSGAVNVKDITIGMPVWSVNARGEKVASPVVSVSHADVPKTHQVIHLVLSDKRDVWVSPNHPTVDGSPVARLRAKERYNGAIVQSVDSVLYWDDKTYDLLPDSETGEYWANGILLRSTMFPRP